MARVVHFEIQAEDTARAMKFYATLFGWTYNQWGTDDYWFVRTDDADKMAGINGAIMKRRGPTPVDGASLNAFVNTIEIPNLDASLVTLVNAGGTVAYPKVAVPTVGWLAYGKDTEGNIFGMVQMDPEAK